MAMTVRVEFSSPDITLKAFDLANDPPGSRTWAAAGTVQRHCPVSGHDHTPLLTITYVADYDDWRNDRLTLHFATDPSNVGPETKGFISLTSHIAGAGSQQRTGTISIPNLSSRGWLRGSSSVVRVRDMPVPVLTDILVTRRFFFEKPATGVTVRLYEDAAGSPGAAIPDAVGTTGTGTRSYTPPVVVAGATVPGYVTIKTYTPYRAMHARVTGVDDAFPLTTAPGADTVAIRVEPEDVSGLVRMMQPGVGRIFIKPIEGTGEVNNFGPMLPNPIAEIILND